MKNNWTLLILSCITLILGVFGLAVDFTSLPTKILGGVLAIVSIIGITWSIILLLGALRPKVYRFVHLYKKADIDYNETYIVAKLTKKEITQLQKKKQVQSMHEFFRASPVIEDIRSILKIDNWPHVKVTGWVYAENQDEALHILDYKEFSLNETDSTPAFFK